MKTFKDGEEFVKLLKTAAIVGAFLLGGLSQLSISEKAETGQQMSVYAYEVLRTEINELWRVHHRECTPMIGAVYPSIEESVDIEEAIVDLDNVMTVRARAPRPQLPSAGEFFKQRTEISFGDGEF